MSQVVTINLRHLTRGLEVSLDQVESVVELLDEGNTVPFITRYRKDRTGGLDEEQIRQIQSRLVKMRLLAERKQTILRSIESQGKLTEKLAQQIQSASTTKRLEDLYLPFKPKKQTLATLARTRGLELLSGEILGAAPSCADLDRRAADFVNADRQVPTAADALLGAGHILAEQFSEWVELRQRLREILQRSGRLTSVQIAGESRPGCEKGGPPAREHPRVTAAAAQGEALVLPPPALEPGTDTESAVAFLDPSQPGEGGAAFSGPPLADAAGAAEIGAPVGAVVPPPAAEAAPDSAPVPAGDAAPAAAPVPADPVVPPPAAEGSAVETPGIEVLQAVEYQVVEAAAATVEMAWIHGVPKSAGGKAPKAPASRAAGARGALSKKEQKKKKAEQRMQRAFSDYFQYSEEIRKVPPHRILAINRGERARVLRVKIESDLAAMHQALDEICIPPGHPHADFLRGCARDALARMILPSLEREARREMTERAEAHAVSVFARNLRNLLLQPPVHDRRVLAVDPGYKNGCKLAALDPFGNVLDHGVMYLVGKAERREEAKRTLAALVEKHQVSVIAVGNGTGCRDSESFVAELIGQELKDKGVAYVIVNEAGASVYSTSRIGREELPAFDASVRGAVSIGRRLQDPLSELVKIDPASIGVGLYQHDVKAKHLRTSLDEVVESCVNYVGVDVNTASPALLRYVSGLNQLTARRLYEYRQQNGPFRNREQLKQVPGFGEAAFVQAAGFLKITGGDNPLDATWIHPESYQVAGQVMGRLQCTAADLAAKEKGEPAVQFPKIDAAPVAAELQVGTHLLSDILAQLARPGRDPREDLPPPVFKSGILKLEDLVPGMELTGTVLNVVDFGAFVDIGMHSSGLVHVSRLADRFIRDPHEVVAVGDIVKVWVVEVDKQRRRVSLSVIPPGSERTGRHPPREAPPAAEPAPQRPPRPEQGPRRPPQGAPRNRPSGGRPAGSRPGGGRPPSSGPGPRPAPRPKPRPKPIVPLTDQMKAGDEPMRTFSDLLQFFELKKQEDSPPQPPAPDGGISPPGGT
jgi:uncharacterized protein